MTWQPIDTAPKDGREILVWSSRDGTFVAFWYEIRNGWFWTSHDLEGDEEINATFWQPLPPPPDE